MDARGKFEEHERSVRVARGDSFLSAPQSASKMVNEKFALSINYNE